VHIEQWVQKIVKCMHVPGHRELTCSYKNANTGYMLIFDSNWMSIVN